MKNKLINTIYISILSIGIYNIIYRNSIKYKQKKYRFTWKYYE